MEDSKGTFRAVADKNGEFVSADPGQRGYIKSPSSDTEELVPVHKDSPLGERKPTKRREVEREYFGIATYPKAKFAEGFEVGENVLPSEMNQVMLETPDPMSAVDNYFALHLGEAQRSETKLPNGTGVVYLLPLKEGVSRSVAVTPTNEKKTLITYGQIHDATSSSAAAVAEKATGLDKPIPKGLSRTANTLPSVDYRVPVSGSIPPPPAGLKEPKTSP